jgi:hypothetical protein
MDVPQDPWVPAPRDGGRADTRAGNGAGGDPWSPTVPFPRVAPAVERLPDGVLPAAPSTALVPRRSAALAVRATGPSGIWRTCVRAVARLVHVTLDGVRSLVALIAAAPASR